MKRKHQWLVAGLLAATMGSAAVVAEKSNSDREDCKRGGKKSHASHHHEFGKHGFRGEEFLNKSYSAEEISILQQARLIRMGNENLKLGKVQSTENGYSVTIVTQDGSLVETKQLAANGMPLEHYQVLKQRLESREPRSE